MEAIQDWMIDYRKEYNYDTNVVVSSLKGNTDIMVIADNIRKDLGLDIEWYRECGSSAEAFNKVRALLEECGVIVMMSGIVGKNTHRTLDINEFRDKLIYKVLYDSKVETEEDKFSISLKRGTKHDEQN